MPMPNPGEPISVSSLDRRTFLKTSALAVSGLALGSSLISACGTSSVESSGEASAAATTSGAKRKAVFASPAINYPFFAPYKVGLFDGCQQVGWEYVGVASEKEYSPQSLANSIKAGAEMDPVVLMTDAEDRGAYTALGEAQNMGVFVELVSANECPEVGAKMGLPWVCADQRASGVAEGTKLLELAMANGAKGGVVLVGTPFPTSQCQINRTQGVKDATETVNGEHGTSFSVVYFTDKSAEDPAQATSLYQAQFTRLGDKLVAISCPGGSTTVPPLVQALKQAGLVGKIPVGSWDTDSVEVDAVDKGYITFFKDQGEYYQGYFGVLNAWAAVERKKEPLNLVTEGGFVTKENLAQFKESAALIDELAKGL